MIATVIIAAFTCLAMISCIVFKPYIQVKRVHLGTYWLVALIGAIITTGVFLIINKTSSNNNTLNNMKPGMMQEGDFNPGQMQGDMPKNMSGKNRKNISNEETQGNSEGQLPDEQNAPSGQIPQKPNEENTSKNEQIIKIKNKEKEKKVNKDL